MNAPRYYSKVAVPRPNDTTAYTALDVLGGATTPGSLIEFANVAPPGGGPMVLLYAGLRIDANALPSGLGQTKLHLYSTAPAAIADNAAYTLAAGDRDKYLGSIALGTPTLLGDTLYAEEDMARKEVMAASSSIWAIAQTIGAWTPTANLNLVWELRAAEV